MAGERLMPSLLGDVVRAVTNRAPVAYTSTGMSTVGGMFNAGQRGRTAELGAMAHSGTLYSVVNRIASSQSAVQWHLYRTARSGRPEDRVEVTRHAALDLVRTPNEFMAETEFCESTQQHEELAGEQWWVVYRSPLSPLPLELWPVRPDRICPVPGGDFLLGYEYTDPDGDKIPLRLDEVIFTKLPNPLDPYRGLGPVGSLLVMLDAVNLSQQWNRNFFLNGAEPGGVLKVPARLTDAQWDEKQKRWAAAHRGVAAAHRVAILEGEGTDWIERKYTQQDMQFAELRTAGRDSVYEAWGVSGSVMGVMEGANRAIADAHRAEFAQLITLPRARRRRTTLNRKLLPLYGTTGQGLEFDFDSPVPEDAEAENATRESLASAFLDYVAAGADGNLVANFLGLPDLGWQPPATPLPLPAPVPGGGQGGTANRLRAWAQRIDREAVKELTP
jgi:HK97 family phage portal protein